MVNTQYGVFLCGSSDGPGSTYAAMAATAVLAPDLTFTWYMGQTPSETHTAWECAAMARRQAAKEGAKDKRWEEWADFAPDDAEPDDAWYEQTQDAGYDAWDEELAATRAALCSLLRDVFGPLPFRPLTLTPSWLCWNDGTVPRLAEAVYGNRAFDHLPILADALEEAGCANTDVLAHLRGVGPHVHGCWPLDLILGKS